MSTLLRKEIRLSSLLMTWLFIGFLLLGGVFHYFDPTENLFLNSFLFSGRFIIFAGLILFWIQCGDKVCSSSPS